VLGLVVAGSRRLRFPLDPRQKGLVLWGVWLITTVGFFSVAGFFHSYYLVTVAPAVAALAGIGIMALWQEYLRRTARWNWRGWLLPLALLVTALAQIQILGSFPDWSRWLSPLILVPTLVAALVLVAARLRPVRALRLWTPAAVALGTLALLLAPTVWSVDTTMTVGSSIPSAGPSAQGGNGFGGGQPGGPGNGRFGGTAPAGQGPMVGPGQPPTGTGSGQPTTGTPLGQLPPGTLSGEASITAGGFGGRNPGGFGGGNQGGGFGGAGVDAQLLSYLEQHQGSTTYLLVTSNSNSAAPYIIATGKPVMSLGGFSGSDPILTLAQFEALVKNNTVRYVLGGGGPGGGGGQDGGSSIMQWVQTTCKAVTLPTTQGTGKTSASGSTAASGGGQDFGGGSALYDCAGA
jgi:4-amino-4-deoxy-L-arabinose transferase-like glycosyltransferase